MFWKKKMTYEEELMKDFTSLYCSVLDFFNEQKMLLDNVKYNDYSDLIVENEMKRYELGVRTMICETLINYNIDFLNSGGHVTNGLLMFNMNIDYALAFRYEFIPYLNSKYKKNDSFGEMESYFLEHCDKLQLVRKWVEKCSSGTYIKPHFPTRDEVESLYDILAKVYECKKAKKPHLNERKLLIDIDGNLLLEDYYARMRHKPGYWKRVPESTKKEYDEYRKHEVDTPELDEITEKYTEKQSRLFQSPRKYRDRMIEMLSETNDEKIFDRLPEPGSGEITILHRQ